MTVESIKREIKESINDTGAKLSLKTKELGELRMEGEDKISVFMNVGELPPEFNDQNLNNQYNRLDNLDRKLSSIQSLFTDALPRLNSLNIEIYKKDIQSKLLDLEKEIEAIEDGK